LNLEVYKPEIEKLIQEEKTRKEQESTKNALDIL
jgi:hypothetical protein